MNEEEYMLVCSQLEYEQNKFNKHLEESTRKENGMRVVINALTEMKDQYEMRGFEHDKS
jgi:hypothetical protein